VIRELVVAVAVLAVPQAQIVFLMELPQQAVAVVQVT
jgi:hypothetical protein